MIADPNRTHPNCLSLQSGTDHGNGGRSRGASGIDNRLRLSGRALFRLLNRGDSRVRVRFRSVFPGSSGRGPFSHGVHLSPHERTSITLAGLRPTA